MKSVTITIPAEHIHSVAQALKERAQELNDCVPHLERTRDAFTGPEGRAIVDRNLNQVVAEIQTLRGLATTLLILGAI